MGLVNCVVPYEELEATTFGGAKKSCSILPWRSAV